MLSHRPPTARQLEVLAFIRDYLARHQRPPSYRDIACHFHINVFAAQRHVKALVGRGLVARQPGQQRSLRLLEGH